jgi:hypothetical protein
MTLPPIEVCINAILKFIPSQTVISLTEYSILNKKIIIKKKKIFIQTMAEITLSSLKIYG